MLLLLLTLATAGEAFRTGSGFVPNFSAIHPPLQRHPGHTVATERRFFHARRHDAQPFQLHMSSESDSEVEALLARAAQLRAENELPPVALPVRWRRLRRCFLQACSR